MPSHPLPHAQHCQTTEEHQANNVLCCQQKRQVQALCNAVTGELQRHKELGQPKSQTCHPGSSPRDVSCCRCNGKWPQGGSVLPVRGRSEGRGRWSFQGRCTLQCPEEKEQLEKLATLSRRWAMTQERCWISITLHLLK